MTAYDAPPPEPPPTEGPYTPPPQPAPYTYVAPRQRPLGVTVLAILEILYGLLMLMAAAGSFLVSALVDIEEIFRQAGMEIPQEFIDAVPFFFGIVGVAFLIIAFLSFLVAYGFLKGRGWSWTLVMVLLVLSIIFSVLGWIFSGLNPGGLVSMLIGILIPVIIVIYLTRPHVKAWFGKA